MLWLGKPSEAELREMLIGRKRFGNAKLSHNQEAACIHNRPFFVAILLEHIPGGILSLLINANHGEERRGAQGVNVREDLLARYACAAGEQRDQLDKNQIGCDEPALAPQHAFV